MDWRTRWMLATGLARWAPPWKSHPHREVSWNGQPLDGGRIYHGWVLQPEQVDRVLTQRLRLAGGRVVVLDVAGLVAQGVGGAGSEAWAVRIDEVGLADATAMAGLRGVFDAGVVVVQTGRDAPSLRRQRALRWVSVVGALPPRPWIVVGVGGVGYLDPWLRVIRDRGIALVGMGEKGG
ncbi:MAG: hypothetical protein AAFX99_15145 [Myxococcota bacterium]